MGPFCLTHPVNFPCERKPECPEKTHDFRHWLFLFSHEDWVRVALTTFSLRFGYATQHELHLWIYYMSKFLNTSEFIIMINSRHILNLPCIMINSRRLTPKGRHTDRTRFGNATRIVSFQWHLTLIFFNVLQILGTTLSNFIYLVCISCKFFIRWRFYLFLKTENSRRVAESRPVRMGLNTNPKPNPNP
jgi:hypothetical protein